jgi:Flp pilus assembly pilin Flp
MILDSINRVFVSAMLAAKREDGQTFVEYSLIGFIVAVAVAAMLITLKGKIGDAFTAIDGVL